MSNLAVIIAVVVGVFFLGASMATQFEINLPRPQRPRPTRLQRISASRCRARLTCCPPNMKRNANVSLASMSNVPTRSKITTMMLLFPLSAACLTLCTACSSTVSVTPMFLPANLAAPCPALQNPPQPAIDPDRLTWEVSVISAYQDCATRHRLVVKSWPH